MLCQVLKLSWKKDISCSAFSQKYKNGFPWTDSGHVLMYCHGY
jgi:hypothetical protein